MLNEKSQLKIGIVLNYINIGVGNLIPIFYTPIMLALLGQSEYGLFKLSSSVTSYLGLASMGIGAAVTRYLIKSDTEIGREEEQRYLGLFMIMFQVIAVVTLLIGIFLVFNLYRWYGSSLSSVELKRMQALVFLMACNTALGFSMSPYTSVVTAHERFIFLQCMNIVATCVGPILNLIVLYLGFASIGMAVASLSLGIMTRFIYFFYVRYRMKIKACYKQLPCGAVREIFGFSFWIFVSNLVVQLYNTTDTVMIGMVPALSTIGVAVYNVGGVFNSIVSSLTTGISAILSPKTNRMVFLGASGRELTNLAIRIGRINAYIITLVVSGFIAFGNPFIRFYAGEEYSEAYWVAVLMMVPNMIPLLQSVCLNIIVAQNKHRFRSLVYLGIAILNVVGTWILMHTKLGIVGAALMTGIALMLGAGLIMNWYYQKRTGLEIIRFWWEIGELFIIPCVMCCITLVIGRWIDFYKLPVLFGGIILYTVLYCIFSWRFTMNQYEKEIITIPLLKIKTLFRT